MNSEGDITMEDSEKEEVGKLAGLGGGVLSGAALGSAIPVPVVGTFVGAVVGGVVGSQVGKTLGRALFDGAEAFVSVIKGDEDKADGSSE
ncbi:MAG TPA: hypothetical protein DEG43_04895 [Acidimicrobiaceae bacterium]|nr:hypothetical protein [Acidimicrobiaceae bacterium]